VTFAPDGAAVVATSEKKHAEIFEIKKK
jgi:hypothetical protein